MLPTILIFSCLIPEVYLLRVPSSVQQVICYSQQVRVLSFWFSLHPASSRDSFVFIRLVFIRGSYFSGGVFCCALVPGTPALDLPTLIL